MNPSRLTAVLAAATIATTLAGCSSSSSRTQPQAPAAVSTSAGSQQDASSTPASSQQDAPSTPTSSTTTAQIPVPTSLTAQFVAKGQTYTPTIDGVHVKVTSEWIPAPPSALTNVSRPGDAVQHASIMVGAPYRTFDLSAVAYGHGVYGEPAFPKAGPGVESTWKQAEISQSAPIGPASDGPIAMIFGKPVTGTVIHRQDAPLAGKQIRIERIFWVIDAGDRLWVLSIERDESGLPADFGAGIEIDANDLSTPTTM